EEGPAFPLPQGEGQQEPEQGPVEGCPRSRAGGRRTPRVPPPALHPADPREPSGRRGGPDGEGTRPHPPGQVRPRRRMVRVRGHAGVQSRPVRAHLREDRPLRADFPGVLTVRRQGRPQAPQRPCVDVPGVRGGPGPGHQRGGQHRQGGRTGRDSLWSAGKTGTRPGTARRSRNPPDTAAFNGAVGGNRRPSGRRGCQRCAEALLEGQGRACRTQAAHLLRQARATAGELGAAPLRDGVELLAARARLGLGAPGPTPQEEPQPGPPADPARSFGLTRRERDVLALVAAGRSNRQIAEELFIAPKTASVHVSNILAKLAVGSRGEAAALAHRLGLLAGQPAGAR
ncbi:response regulator transcription factor, partial [Streptomyces sp. JJ66]|nr:response regulator transcription factor [Streptomyces sp. JJ66]